MKSPHEKIKEFNNRLNEYAEDTEHLYVIEHSNLRTLGWTLYADDKHIHHLKNGKYAANIIRTLKTAYNISSKNELFSNSEPRRMTKNTDSARNNGRIRFNVHNQKGDFSQIPDVNSGPFNFKAPTYDHGDTNHMGKTLQHRLHHLANYDQASTSINASDEISNIKHGLLTKLQDAIQKALM